MKAYRIRACMSRKPNKGNTCKALRLLKNHRDRISIRVKKANQVSGTKLDGDKRAIPKYNKINKTDKIVCNVFA
jgi:hypothetical protein